MILQGPLDGWVAELRERGPAAESAGRLGGLEVAQLSARGRIDALVVLEQHLSWLQAKQVEVLAAIAEHSDVPEAVVIEAGGKLDDVFAATWDGAVEEVACALRLSHLTAGQRLRAATLPATRHEVTTGLLADRRISYMQAQAVAEQLE
ncbi:hypothetical protein ACWZEH_12185 [Streptomyces sp. QTS137]